MSSTQDWCPCAGAALCVSPALPLSLLRCPCGPSPGVSGCPCMVLVRAQVSVPRRSSPAVPLWVSLSVCPQPGLGVAGCPCPSLSAPGLCPRAGSLPAVPWLADREGQSPIPTPQGITRGSAQLCLIRRLQGLGLARGQGGHPGVLPSRTRHVAAGDIKGGLPSSIHWHHWVQCVPQHITTGWL